MRKLLLVDGHRLLTYGLKETIKKNLHVRDIDITHSCNGFLRALKCQSYTHVITDLMLKDGIVLEILSTIRALYGDLRIMIYSGTDLDPYIPIFFKHRIYYYVNKASCEQATLGYIARFLNNETPKVDALQTKHPFDRLSERELEVIHYVCLGYATKEIASMLNLKMNTVSTIKYRIYQKTGESNIVRLMRMFAVYTPDRLGGLPS